MTALNGWVAQPAIGIGDPEHHMSDPVVLAVVAVIAIIAGFGIGFVARSVMASQSIKAAQDKSGAHRRGGARPAEGTDPPGQGRAGPPRSARPRKRPAPSAPTWPTLERRLLQRDEQLDQRTDMLEERDRKLMVKEQELETQREAARAGAPGAARGPGAASARCRVDEAK